jgi:hypothetical protein
MLLQCESTSVAGAARAAAWLPPGALVSLAELNELALTVLAEQAAVHAAQPSLLLRQIGDLSRALDAPARRRAAACPYLLLDAGFAEPGRWRARPAAALAEHGVGDSARDGGGRGAPYSASAFFTVPGAGALARLVLIYAWHLARSQSAAARLLLGMPAACAALIGELSLLQIEALAESHREWVRPRWPGRVAVWRELLLAAAAGEGPALERARLHGLTLLAAEARVPSPGRPAASVAVACAP